VNIEITFVLRTKHKFQFVRNEKMHLVVGALILEERHINVKSHTQFVLNKLFYLIYQLFNFYGIFLNEIYR